MLSLLLYWDLLGFLVRLFVLDETISFSAVKTSTQEVQAGANIHFETELIDTHNGFSPASGIYVIPMDGIYEVNVNLFKMNGTIYNDVFAELLVGDTALASISNYEANVGGKFHSSASVIREFRVNDFLRVRSSSAKSFYGAPQSSGSQFSAKYLGPPLNKS